MDPSVLRIIATQQTTISLLLQLIRKVNTMSAQADDLRREIQETKDKVAQLLQFVADLKQQLADALANATGLTNDEVAVLAKDLDALQSDIDAGIGAPAPTPAPPPAA